MVDVAEVLEVFDRKVVPFHQEDAGHEAVGYYTVWLASTPFPYHFHFCLHTRLENRGERTYQVHKH